MSGAVAGLITGTLVMTVVMVLWNYLITPIYMGYPREAVVDLLLPAIVPFNLLKGAINTSLTLLLYKPLVTALRKSHLLVKPVSQNGPANPKKLTIGVTLAALLLLITCILTALAVQGKM